MIVLLVHGWSVTHTRTYGDLGARLEADSRNRRLPSLAVRDVYLGKYVSFSDEVRLEDISRAFEAAVQTELARDLARGERLAVITHSTGGPVIRDWWQRYYRSQNRPCPMQHLIMLAPANFGSALAQLGKTRIADLKASIVDGVDPGVGVLDWLEHGSPEAWALNNAWIQDSRDPAAAADPLYQFVLTGQSIDRKLYDHVNSYTGEPGSDGVVRVAAANLNASYLKLTQESPDRNTSQKTVLRLTPSVPITAPKTAFALIRGRSHTSKSKGILRSIKTDGNHPTYRAIVRCLKVRSTRDYGTLTAAFERENATVRKNERYETSGRLLKHEHFTDAHGIIIARIRDDGGHVPERMDFKFTGPGNNPDGLPSGMIVDRQRNRRSAGTLTFYLNADAALGAGEVSNRRGSVVRRRLPGLSASGIALFPRPRDAYVGHAIAQLGATLRNLENLVKRDQTVLLDIELKRIVRSGTFALTTDLRRRSFKDQNKGKPIG
jgi:hypothetical protein